MSNLSRLADIRRPTRVRFGVLAFVCSLSLLTYLDRICIMRAKENMHDDLGFSDLELGWIFSAFTLGYALSEVPGGWIGDRWGARRVLAEDGLAGVTPIPVGDGSFPSSAPERG